MAGKININYGIIFKRSSCINYAVCESKNDETSRRYFSTIESYLAERQRRGDKDYMSSSLRSFTRSFMESIANIDNASSHYRDPLYLMQEFNELGETTLADYVLNEYTSKVLPYVYNLECFSEPLNRYNLTEKQRKMVIETAAQYAIADRILSNHERISKRFNIVQEVSKVKGKGMKYVVESCCQWIDTYGINQYAKMNLCFEELCFLFEKTGIENYKKDLVKYVTEYFLLRQNTLSDKDIKGYHKVLKENCFLEFDDIKDIDYIFDDIKMENFISIKSQIKEFLVCRNKSIEKLDECVRASMGSTNLDIKTNINSLLWLIWDVYRVSMFDINQMREKIPYWFNLIVLKLEDEIAIECISKSDLIIIHTKICRFKEVIVVDKDTNYDAFVSAELFKHAVGELCNQIDTLSDIVYYESNVQSIKEVNEYNGKPIPLNEFKTFKFHNLTKSAIRLEKLLKEKTTKLINKGSINIRKIAGNVRKLLLGEDAIYSFIGEDARVDICVAQYGFDDSVFDPEIETTFNSICSEFNTELMSECGESLKSYYIIHPNLIEVRIKESAQIALEDNEWDLIKTNAQLNEFECYIESMAETEVFSNILGDTINTDKILAGFFEHDGLTLEHFELALEALSLTGVSKEKVKLFAESFTDYRYCNIISESSIIEESETEFNIESFNISQMVEKWKPVQDTPIEVQIEAVQILHALLEDAPKKPIIKSPIKKKEEKHKDDPNTKVDESRKNPFKGINLNSMRLYLEGLKTKAKDMSQKEKEISRTIDNEFRRLVKAIKDALISDRREAIIKGSVVPSFSKCIKICIGLAGMGFITGNPMVPLLTAIGGFAASKRLTQKERILLLDEIETELEVVEKEISMAESKNQLKKYRTLLKYKKDLQRQYQRIRYNVRVGKDLLPGSTTGVKTFDK